MTEAERRDPEPSALIERLLRRRTEPLGIIDVRHAQAHYARMAGWIEARFPLLIELAARHGLSGEGEAGAAEFIYAGRALPHPGEQPVCVPGTPVFARQASSGGGTPEKSPLTCQKGDGGDPQRRARGDLQTGERKTLRASTEAYPVTSVEPPPSPAAEGLEVSPLRRGRLRGGSVFPLAKGEDEKTPSSVLPLAKGEDEKTTKLANTVWRVRRGRPESATTLIPDPHRVHSPKPVPYRGAGSTPSPGLTQGRVQSSDAPQIPAINFSLPLTKQEVQGEGSGIPSFSPSPLQGEGGDGGRRLGRAFCPSIVAPLSFNPHPNPPPARGRESAFQTQMDPDRKGPDRKGSVQSASLPRYPSATITAVADRLPKGVEASLVLAPKDRHAAPLIWRRISAAHPDRAMEAGDAREQRRMFPPATSQQASFGKLSRNDITEHPPVSQTIVPIPERPRLRLSKREWAELIERLSRLIRHKLAVDLDRRGLRLWRS